VRERQRDNCMSLCVSERVKQRVSERETMSKQMCENMSLEFELMASKFILKLQARVKPDFVTVT